MKPTGLSTACAALVVFVAACGAGSPTLLTVREVRSTFVRQGLPTKIVFERGGCPQSFRAKQPTAVLNRCSASALMGPHVAGLLTDPVHGVSHVNFVSALTVFVLDSVSAARQYDQTAASLDRSFVRLQARNVVVLVWRHDAYLLKARAAVRNLG